MSVSTTKYLQREGNTVDSRNNLTNDRDLRAPWIVATLKVSCIAFCVENEVKYAFKRGNITNRMEIPVDFRQNLTKNRFVRAPGIVSTLKQSCTPFGV
jgi:hypothetical protein